MENTFKVIVTDKKEKPHAFLVALVPVLSIPSEFKSKDIVSEFAVIAANDCGDGEWAYIHLESSEKQAIGNKLTEECRPVNTWFWCELYSFDLSHPGQYPESRVKWLRDVFEHLDNRYDLEIADMDEVNWFIEYIEKNQA